MRKLMLAMAFLLTGVAIWQMFQPEAVSTEVTSAVTVEIEAETVSAQPSTTTTQPPALEVPMQEADETHEWFTDANTVNITAASVGIDFPVDSFGSDGANSCGSQSSPCFERVNNFVSPDSGLVSACQQGVSLFSGHSVWHKGADSFSNIFDDEEFDWDKGLATGDSVVAELSDGSLCFGMVKDFDEGPGEILPGNDNAATARFWLKSDLSQAAGELVNLYGQESYGVLMASFCNQCRFPDDFIQRSDGSWHRLYNVAILVEWTHVQPAGTTPDGAR